VSCWFGFEEGLVKAFSASYVLGSGFAGGYAYSWFDAPRGLKPKRRPEDQAGLTICHNFSTPILRKSEVALHRCSYQKTKARLCAWADRARGEKFLFGIAVTH